MLSTLETPRMVVAVAAGWRQSSPSSADFEFPGCLDYWLHVTRWRTATIELRVECSWSITFEIEELFELREKSRFGLHFLVCDYYGWNTNPRNPISIEYMAVL